MRSVFLSNNKLDDEIILTDKLKLNHLVNVIRLKPTESIRVFNQYSKYRDYKVQDIIKSKCLTLKSKSFEMSYNVDFNIHCCFGVTKKEAWDDIVRAGIEMGVSSLISCRMDRSQMSLSWNQRLLYIIETSMEQSNHYYYPKLLSMDNGLSDLNFTHYDRVVVLTSQGQANTIKQISFDTFQHILMIVGPEGGFSDNEIEYLKNQKNIDFLSIEGPIKKTPNAIVAGFSQILGAIE
jgi:16S rRNA (uracil1498-N3)-methyltransferase